MRISASAHMSGATSGRKSIGPRGPGTPSGSGICGWKILLMGWFQLGSDGFRMRRRLLRWRVDIAFVRHVRAHGNISLLLLRSPGGETVHVAVVHAEGRGDQDCVVNLGVGCAFLASTRNVLGGNALAALLHMSG